MQHLDEGTIHAWLDGALTSDEATRVQQHASECKECAAMVAEARGLVAGASRILSALDEVPGVVPGHVAGAAATIESIEARRHAKRRRFWSRPAALAVAASVILMAGTAVVWREGGGPQMRAVQGDDAVPLPTTEGAASAAAPAPGQGVNAQRDTTRAAGAVAGNAGRAAPARPRRAVDGAGREAARQTAPGPSAQRAPVADAATAQSEAKEIPAIAPAPARLLDRARKAAAPQAAMAPSEPDAATRRAAMPRAAAARSRLEQAIATTGADVPQQTVRRIDTLYQVRTDTIAVSRVDTIIAPAPGPPELRGAARPGAATRPFTVTGCYEVVGGGPLRSITLTNIRVWSGAAEHRFEATAPGAVGYWSQPRTGDVHVMIAGMLVTARIDASTGELRGTTRRGGKSERFVARRGCR